VLALLSGRRGPRPPCFSGLINVTEAGLAGLGLALGDVHQDANKMAAAAATTYRLSGFESAVAPLDLCVEAEALGAQVDFQAGAPRPVFPTVLQPAAASAADLDLRLPLDLTRRGRLPVVAEALRLLKADVGQEVVVGAWVPGPFTLALHLLAPGDVLLDVAQAPEAVGRLLDPLADALAEVARFYREAGADFITVHEMGGSPGYLGPRAFERLVLPRLQRLLAALPAPRVLSVCGNTNRALPLLAQAGADALSVDQLNDLARSRQALGPQAIVFGNLDPVRVLAEGDEAAVREAVGRAVEAGADAVWPGCDLAPSTPAGNLRAMVEAVRRHSRP
jgi:[methyl-Co(III) methanol-specific corrinoid protein]:coenzyme M methyltransferase